MLLRVGVLDNVLEWVGVVLNVELGVDDGVLERDGKKRTSSSFHKSSGSAHATVASPTTTRVTLAAWLCVGLCIVNACSAIYK